MGGAARLSGDLDAGVLGCKFRQRSLKDHIVEIIGNADGDAAGDGLVKQGRRALQFGQRAAGCWQELAALVVQGHAAGMAVEQWYAQCLFQFAQLYADR